MSTLKLSIWKYRIYRNRNIDLEVWVNDLKWVESRPRRQKTLKFPNNQKSNACPMTPFFADARSPIFQGRSLTSLTSTWGKMRLRLFQVFLFFWKCKCRFQPNRSRKNVINANFWKLSQQKCVFWLKIPTLNIISWTWKFDRFGFFGNSSPLEYF